MINYINLDNFALTGNVSRINEDSLTAQQLLIRSARKSRECLRLLAKLGYSIKTAQEETVKEYDAWAEELTLYDKVILTAKDIPITFNRFYFLFAENSKSLIELAGDINKAINECLTFIDKLCGLLLNIDPTKEDTVKELRTHLDSCYVNVFDECSYTTLELAGYTARYVNEFVKSVNMLNDTVNTFDNITPAVAYSVNEEQAEIAGAVNDEEIFEI